MISFMAYCFFFIFLSKLLSLKNGAMKFSSVAWIWKHLSHFFILKILRKQKACLGVEKVNDESGNSLLDLPELALDLILERLEPKTLSNVTSVCSYLREKCVSDHVWERHMKEKWGRLIGDAAHREWECHITSKNKSTHLINRKQKTFFGYDSSFWLFNRGELRSERQFSPLPEDSIMAWYLALETGKFWFPGQVYNREVQNGNIGFMLSCYDAELGYDSATNSFKARYSPQGRSTVEYDIGWDRVRLPAVDTPSHSLHTSDCLDDLAPGDHIEIQWRRNKDFPYGWWYGVVGHLESCDRNQTHCQCQNSDTVILEFKHYTPGSRWRITEINRKEHREIGNEADGFYGGIRKLYREDEISVWKRLWPTRVLE